MTYELETLSHGNVYAGFKSNFMQFTRMGDYVIPTKQFCEVVQQIAENPDVRFGKILAYDMDKFHERNAEHMFGSHSRALAEEQDLPELEAYEKSANTVSRELSLEDELDLDNEGQMVGIKINDNSIFIGKYEISDADFGIFALYVVQGGHFGWSDEHPPLEYTESAEEAILSSENTFFNYARDEINHANLRELTNQMVGVFNQGLERFQNLENELSYLQSMMPSDFWNSASEDQMQYHPVNFQSNMKEISDPMLMKTAMREAIDFYNKNFME